MIEQDDVFWFVLQGQVDVCLQVCYDLFGVYFVLFDWIDGWGRGLVFVLCWFVVVGFGGVFWCWCVVVFVFYVRFVCVVCGVGVFVGVGVGGGFCMVGNWCGVLWVGQGQVQGLLVGIWQFVFQWVDGLWLVWIFVIIGNQDYYIFGFGGVGW